MNNEHNLYWAKYSPTSLEGYIGNPLFRADLQKWIEEGSIPNIILSGRAGSGKTTAAKVITSSIPCDSLYINASDENGIDTIREKVKSFASTASFMTLKIIVLDEADFLTPAAQSALRNIIETFSSTTRFIFTCNYFERMLEPIQSRLERYELKPPTKSELAAKCKYILEQENIKFENTELAKVVNLTYPDTRQCLIKLQSFSKTGKLIITDTSKNIEKEGEEIIKLLKGKNPKDFNKIRQIVADLDLKEYSELYRLLFDKLDEYSDNITIPWMIAESQYKAVTAPDREIQFIALISKILNNK